MRPVVVAEGLEFPEGPTFDPTGNLYIVNLAGGYVTRIAPDGIERRWAETGGRPNGAAWDHRRDALTVCDAGRREVLSISREREIVVLARECDGCPLAGPNDCCYDAQNNLYFTDPLGSSLERRTGRVLFMTPGGEVSVFDEGYAFSNGIAFGPDGRLYVAESRTRRIWRYALDSPGRYRSKELHTELTGERGPDGMAFDAEGNLYIAHIGKGCVAVVSPEGTVFEELPVGGREPTNVAFGGPGNDDLYVTEAETRRVYRLPLGRKGLLTP